MSIMRPVLEVEDLSVHFNLEGRLLPIIDTVTFAVGSSETIAIVGESGSGKSITALAIMGLLPAPAVLRTGRVELDGICLSELSASDMRQVRGNRLSMIFQEPMSCLNPVMTVGAQIAEVLKVHGDGNKKKRQERVLYLLEEVGLTEPGIIKDLYPHQLSGGMNQRVMIAMAIACNPDVLIADEPTTALDVTVQAQILELLKRLREMNGMAMVFISHDLAVVSEIADRVIVMYAGQVVEHADVNSIMRHPAHPYTQALLKGQAKNFDEREGRFYVIPGNPPAFSEAPDGCRFHPRCRYAQDQCRTTTPAMEQLRNGTSSVRCFYPLFRVQVS